MPTLLILTSNPVEYLNIVQRANLPGLSGITSHLTDDCDIVLGETKLIQEALPLLPNLKWVQTTSAGVERLLDPALRRDYILTNARDVFGELMSEYVFGHLLYHEKKIFTHYQNQQAKRWERTESGVLRGKTIGLLGVGSIGAHLAGMAKHFRMKVWGYTRESETSKHVDRYFHGDELLNFARELAYLVVVLPKTEGTNGIVDANLLSALPPHAVFINVGRGNAVDETALVDALTKDKIAAAVLDVTETEPLPEQHPFWTTPNLLLTFHTSAISYPEDMTRLFIENYHLYIEGKPLKHQVDFQRGY